MCLTNNVLQECKQTIKNLNNKHAGDWPGYNIPEGTAAKLTCLLRKYHPENTHLLHDGQFHCMADILFGQLDFSRHLCYVKIINRLTCLVESKPVKQMMIRKTYSDIVPGEFYAQNLS